MVTKRVYKRKAGNKHTRFDYREKNRVYKRKGGGKHTRFPDSPVARRKYVRSGKYKGVHGKRISKAGHFLRHITL